VADVYELTRANVQKGWEKIRQATDGKRRVAFAVGDMGAEIPVVLVVPGVTPSQAKTRLASAAYLAQYKSGEAPKGIDLKRTQGKKVANISYGELHWDPQDKILYLDCERNGNKATIGKKFERFYRFQWGHTPFWTDMKLGDLPDGAEHVLAADTGEAVMVPTSAGEPTTADTATVEGADGDPEPAITSQPPPVESQTSPADAQEMVTDEIVRKKAQRAEAYLLRSRRTLGIADAVDPAEVEEALAQIPPGVSYDRVLLELVRTPVIADVPARLAHEPSLPLEGDEAGLDEVFSAVLAMGTRVAEQRGLLGHGANPSGAAIRAQLGEVWNRHAGKQPADRIEAIINFYRMTFDKMDDDRLCGFLGLARVPVDAATRSWLTLWHDACANVLDVIEQLKRVVDQELKAEDPSYSVRRLGSWQTVDSAVRELGAAEFMQTLRAWSGAKGAERQDMNKTLREKIDSRLSHANSHWVITELDRNPFGVPSAVRDRLVQALTTIRGALPSS
jgi:hypothetical protein